GFSLEEFKNVRDTLAMNKIKYKYRVVNLNENRNRRSLGSFGNNRNLEIQYYVFVQRKDYEQANYFVNKALHQI
ncbi:MAG: hypothetical protein K0S61_4943, partial [Anaerocolumna sp.]|nr:hypothetical protein [Anaerocolumna sp.]